MVKHVMVEYLGAAAARSSAPMVFSAAASSDEHVVPKPLWQRCRGIVLLGVTVLTAVLAAVTAFSLSYEPAFYRRALAAAGDGPENEARARRLVTKASALHAAIFRPGARTDGAPEPGRWETAIRDDEINAWLAIDLPRSHPDWIPGGMAAPRIGFGARRALLGARVGSGGLSAVASCEFEIVLRDVNEIGIVLERARLGAIPLPRAAIVRELARRIDRLGMVADLRRLDGRLMLVVHVPSSHGAGASSHRIESLSLAEGELLMAGTTRPPAEPRPGGPGSPP